MHTWGRMHWAAESVDSGGCREQRPQGAAAAGSSDRREHAHVVWSLILSVDVHSTKTHSLGTRALGLVAFSASPEALASTPSRVPRL